MSQPPNEILCNHFNISSTGVINTLRNHEQYIQGDMLQNSVSNTIQLGSVYMFVSGPCQSANSYH